MYKNNFIKPQEILRMSSRVIPWLCVLVSCCAFYGQQRQDLDIPKDHEKWYTIHSNLLVSGHWFWYHKNYPNALDTLVLQQTKGVKKYVLPGCSEITYLGNNFVSVNCDSTINLIDLNNGNKERLDGVSELNLIADNDYLLLFKHNENELVLRDLNKGISKVFYGVYQYLYSDKAKILSMAINSDKGNELKILHLNDSLKLTPIVSTHSRKILEMCWAENGDYLSYRLQGIKNSKNRGDAGHIGFYDLKRKVKFIFDPSTNPDFPESYKLTSNQRNPLRISLDGKRVFFTYSRKVPLKRNSNPEVWKVSDPYIYKRMSSHMDWQNTPLVGVWTPKTDSYIAVTSLEFPKSLINKSKNYAIVYNPLAIESQYKLNPPIDLYLKDLSTGERKLFLKKYRSEINSIQFSPSGRYILYFKEGAWWIYDTKDHLHLNMNTKLNKFLSKPYFSESSKDSEPPGWSKGEKILFMYDSLDLWSVPLDKGTPKRITNGEEEDIRYRLISNYTKRNFGDKRMINFKDDQLLVFSIEKEDLMGYTILENGEMNRISFNNVYTRWPNISNDGGIITFMEETFYKPPRIMVYNTKTRQLRVAFQSNSHYNKYKRGTSRLIQFRNQEGDTLSGILRFPPNYDKDSLYPMVVRVYQKQRHYLHQYINPGFNNSTGYNPSNLLAKGYVVFLPDINYKIGEPGFSAADCIISGTKEAIKQASINPTKIGLIGQSFGGYETLFTITQTNLFATAIAGAAIASFPMDYLHIDGGVSLNYNRYENLQLRMGKSLFEDYKGYLDNSPLYHAKNISTPLLLWSGKEDHHVFYYQSLSFHLALKRLGKENTFLFYPGEGHFMSNWDDKKDLTIRVHQWLDHYLKREPKQEWIP